jgi:hypothetical protein
MVIQKRGTMIDLLIYQNDNGTTVTDVTGNEIDYEEWLVQRVEELPENQECCKDI